MDDIAKKIIDENLYNICRGFIENDIPFSMVIENHNNWNEEFPVRLKDKPQFLIDIKEQTLDDSYVQDGVICIVIDIDNTDYIKKLDYSDIRAISINQKTPPFLIKPFRTLPEMNTISKKNKMPSDEELSKSIANFKKYNPKMFEN